MSNISELQYFGLSDNIYKRKYLKVNVVAPLTKEREEKLTTIILEDASRWVVIESVDKDNGLQAAAVVRLKEYRDVCNGKLKKFENIVFVSRGSQELADWETNASLATKKMPEYGDQFFDYQEFIKGTLRSYDTEEFSFTGHSLGGALAQYGAVKYNKQATTFAAARSFNKLTAEEQQQARDGAYFNQIKDYRHTGDVVGSLPPGAFVFYQQFVSKNASGGDLYNAHMPEGFRGQFNSNGSIKLKISPDDIQRSARELHAMAEDITKVIRALEDFREDEARDMKKLQRDLEDATFGGEYDLLMVSEVDDVIHEVAVHKREGVYRLHNDDLTVELIENLQSHQKELLLFSDAIGRAAYEMQRNDQEAGQDLARYLGGTVGALKASASELGSQLASVGKV
ncbi:lipase family protein [Listeria booriae]|uniref:Lipase n=2 Tax=Listeria booriae TaxID=1552123 RepID=A0A842AQ88_9LIST|nr:lipase [Listeria booriae]MBC1318514.1 lipase [Listeria booriae]MBC1618018.1 lipase [Listeria booriae]MBC2388823.1 lipase [Listeria booriae]